MESTYSRLRGGDLRSIGAADEIAREAESNLSVFCELVGGLCVPEGVVRMRCADALEKVTRTHPEYLAPYAKELLKLIDPEQPKELLWHVVQMAPRVAWTGAKLPKVFQAVEACLASTSSIVKASAMQALFELTQQAPSKVGEVSALIRELLQTGTPAMKARGAKLLRKLAR